MYGTLPTYRLEEGDSKELRNVGNIAYTCTMPSPRNRINISTEPSWKPEIFSNFYSRQWAVHKEHPHVELPDYRWPLELRCLFVSIFRTKAEAGFTLRTWNSILSAAFTAAATSRRVTWVVRVMSEVPETLRKLLDTQLNSQVAKGHICSRRLRTVYLIVFFYHPHISVCNHSKFPVGVINLIYLTS
jgi:hypothetical protein